MSVTEQNLQNGLPFIEAKHYKKGRTRRVRVLVIHTAECGENPTAAEGILGYNTRRSDKVSCHEAVDNNSVVAGVRPWDTAWTTGPINDYAYSWELAGRARQTRAEWADAYSSAQLKLLARRVALAAVCWNIPIRKLTPAQLKAGEAGICGHHDQTVAWNVKGGHWDPGPNFPWAHLLDLVRAEIVKLNAAPAPEPSAAAPAAAKPLERTYTVKQGDSYWSIARRELKAAKRYTEIKNLNNNRPLRPGMTLTLPAK